MKYKNIIVTLVVSFGVLIGMSFLLFNSAEVSDSGETQIVEGVEGEMRNVKGSGKVTIVEFSDFQCPACRASQIELDRILNKYEGEVKLVYRHLPLTSIHRFAQSAAWAAEAAGKQGKFFEYHDLLFEKQTEWSEGDAEEYFYSYAEELGFDVEKFKTDYMSSEVRDLVSADLLYANRLGLSSTPSFFVSGEKVNLNNMELKIESLISGE